MLLSTQFSRYFWCCILCLLILASDILCVTKDKSLAKKSTVNVGAAIGVMMANVVGGMMSMM
ncbi:hypothetical protein CDAR_111761, partial [Caerostris darwini]